MSKLKQLAVDDFNAKCPVGSLVRYWTRGREGTGHTGKTRTHAELLSGHTPVVWIEGVQGCIALTHVEPIV